MHGALFEKEKRLVLALEGSCCVFKIEKLKQINDFKTYLTTKKIYLGSLWRRNKHISKRVHAAWPNSRCRPTRIGPHWRVSQRWLIDGSSSSCHGQVHQIADAWSCETLEGSFQLILEHKVYKIYLGSLIYKTHTMKSTQRLPKLVWICAFEFGRCGRKIAAAEWQLLHKFGQPKAGFKSTRRLQLRKAQTMTKILTFWVALGTVH